MALTDSGVRLRLWSDSSPAGRLRGDLNRLCSGLDRESSEDAGMQQAILALTAAALLVAVASLALAGWQLYQVYSTEPLTMIVPALTR
jgi:hypothetical protein